LYYEEPIEKPTRVLLKERPLSEEELVAKKQKLKELLQREVEDDE
jgi:hypothetical protein